MSELEPIYLIWAMVDRIPRDLRNMPDSVADRCVLVVGEDGKPVWRHVEIVPEQAGIGEKLEPAMVRMSQVGANDINRQKLELWPEAIGALKLLRDAARTFCRREDQKAMFGNPDTVGLATGADRAERFLAEAEALDV